VVQRLVDPIAEVVGDMAGDRGVEVSQHDPQQAAIDGGRLPVGVSAG
jgi:hypothetical protein